MDDFSQKLNDPQQKNTEEGASSWFGALAIIIAILAIVAASFAWEEYQSVMSKDTSTNAVDTSIHHQLESSVQELQTQLHITQQNVNQLMQTRTGDNAVDSLNQISSLLNAANLQLLINRDDQAAETLLMQAQSKLDAVSDSRFFTLNKLLLSNIQTLKADASFNLTKLISNIDLLSNSIMNSSLIPNKKDLNKAERKAEENVAMQDAGVHTWLERIWYHLSGLKELIIIRHNNPKLIPLLDTEQQILVKSLLQNKLLLVEYAAIQRNNDLYQSQLKIVGQWITTYYFNSVDRQDLLTQVGALRSVNVAIHLSNINDTITLLTALQSPDNHSNKLAVAR